MADNIYSEFINILQFSTGRRRYAYSQSLAALAGQHPALIAFAKEGLAKDEQVAALEQRYYSSRATATAPRSAAVDIDNHFDRVLGALWSSLDNAAAVFRPGSDTAKAAHRIAVASLPDGAGGVTHSAFEDELATGKDIVAKLKGKLAGDVAKLGLGPLVDELERTVKDFDQALSKQPATPVRFDAVRAARAGGQQHLERYVAKLLASDDLDDAGRLAALAPIRDQNARIRSYYARRRAVPDVNPTTGEELPAPADTQAPAHAHAPVAAAAASSGNGAPAPGA